MSRNKQLIRNIGNELEIGTSDELTDEEMLRHIADRVEQMLKGDPDLLMSYLYRLDVTEKSIEKAMKNSPFPAAVTFANLIWERQKQRLETRKKYKQDPIEGWEF